MRDAFRSGRTADVYALELDADLVADGGLRRLVPGGPGCRDPALRVPSPLTPAFLEHRGRARAAAPQHHPPRVLRGLGRRARAHLPRRARRAGEAGAALRPRARRQRVQPARARGAGRRATGVLPILLDFDRYREPASPVRSACWRRSRRPAVRRRLAPNKRPKDLIRPRELLEALSGAGRARAAGGQAAAPARTSTRCRRSPTRRASRPPRWCSSGTSRTTSCCACYAAARVFCRCPSTRASACRSSSRC